VVRALLPVIAYERDARALGQIEELMDAAEDSLRVVILTGDAREAGRFLDAQTGVLLAVAGVLAPSEGDGGLAFARCALEKNRDNYLVVVVPSVECLEEVLSGSLRVSGALVRPIRQDRARSLFQRLSDDYQGMVVSPENALIFHAGASVIRVPRASLLYVEAIGKKLELWTARQRFSVYASLADLEQTLKNDFVRCHRSFLINLAAVERVDFSRMEARMRGGSVVPISRSQKAVLKARLEGEGGEAGADGGL
jgi:hypothetical protein